MPVSLSNTIRRAIADARLSPDEVATLKSAIATGKIKGPELALLSARYSDLFEAGTGAAVAAISPPTAFVAIPGPIRSLGDSYQASKVLSGDVTLSPGDKGEQTALFQRALNAIASREGKPVLGVTKFGADGDYGNEMTAAVKAFQTDNQLPVTGSVDQLTALAIEHQLMLNPPPDIGGVTGPVMSVADGERIAKAARELVATRADDYGVSSVWRSPNPTVPGNDEPGKSELGAIGRWKCNLFGMDSLFNGGAQTPHYPGGNYPIAVEIPNYTRSAGDNFVKLGEVWPAQTTPEKARATIAALLKVARPGDVIIVNHPGNATDDGGHTRVVVGNKYDKDGTVDCAQAGFDKAVIVGETLESFTGEDAFYLLRPAHMREEEQPPTVPPQV